MGVLPNSLFRHITKADDFVQWLCTEGDVLISATDLLGGHIWAAKAKEIVVTARKSGNVAARRKTLIALQRLLQGDYARFLELDEAWRFASLHPDDPKATCAMLCAEALGRGIRAFEALHIAGISNITEVM